MVADPVAWLHDDQIEPQREARDGVAVWKGSAIEQAVRRGTDARSLSMIDGLLGESEVAAGSPADLDHHEGGGRTRVDRH